jgi:hypothetical protein
MLSSLLLQALLLIYVLSTNAFYFRIFSAAQRSLSISEASIAKETTETIDPAVYRSDLYEVLNVSSSSTQRQIRDAYLVIAVANHPDRNSSQQALELYRNASYAYKFLGKDPNTRSKYDVTYNAENLATALGEVGSEIVLPLARDIALPLLNMTVRGISSIATPFVRNIVEQSKSVIDAVSSTEDVDVQKRVLSALSKTRYEQQLRSLTERIDTTDKKITQSLEELEYAVENKITLTKLISEISDRLKLENETAINALRYINRFVNHFPLYLYLHLLCLDRTLVSYKDELTEVRKLASFACSEVEDKLNKRIGLKSKSDSLEVSVASSRNEIVRLEAALTSERRKLEQFLFEKNSVDDLLAVATTAEEVCRY